MASKQHKEFRQKIGKELTTLGGQDVAYAEWFLSVPDRALIEVVYQIIRHMKSPAQLGYYHAGIIRPAVQILRDRGEDDLAKLPVMVEVGLETNEKNLDGLIKRAFQIAKQLPRTPSKANMTDEIMSQLIEFASDWLPRNLHVPVQPATRN